MTFYLYVLQNQWIFITLLSGLFLTLLMCLTYQALWHPRGVEEKAEKVEVRGTKGFFNWLLGFVPWVIVLLVAGSVVFTVLTLVAKSMDPPNW
jgi:hypothetical protein